MFKNSAIFFIKVFLRLFALIPQRIFVFCLYPFIRIFFFFSKKYKKIVDRNLALTYPVLQLKADSTFWNRLCFYLTDLIASLLRIYALDEKWAREQVILDNPQFFKELREKNPNQGVLIIAAHGGLFEYIPFVLSIIFRPIGVVVRVHKGEFANKLFNAIRVREGARLIPRTGALRRMIKDLRSGLDVGIVCDQNVVRKDAVFVNWFGVQAATTVSLGAVALKANCPIVAVHLLKEGPDKYRVYGIEVPYSDILRNEELSEKDKMSIISQRCSDQICELIKLKPEFWFWIHRRWKTRPEGEPENIYI